MTRYLPAIIFIVALGIRLIGLGWGLPNKDRSWSLHPDEPIVAIYSSQVNPLALDFDPGFYNYGTLYLSTLSIASKTIGADISKATAPAERTTSFSQTHLVGRLINVLAGSFCALIAFGIGRRFYGNFAAVFCGLSVAFAPGFVVHSKFQTVDVFSTLWVFAAIAAALSLLPGRGDAKDFVPQNAWKSVALAGLFVGLAAGTKYTGAVALIPVLAALFASNLPGKPRLAGIAVIASGLAFLVATPGALINSNQFFKDLSYEFQHTATGHGLVFEGTGSGFSVHIFNLIVGFGALLTIAGVIGLALASRRIDRAAVVLSVFAVAYYILIGRSEVAFMRYTFPLLLPLGVGVGYLMERLKSLGKWGHIGVAAGIFGLSGIVDGGGAKGGLLYSSYMALEDPRDAAGRYLREKNIEASTTGLVSDPWFYSPSMFPDAAAPRPLFINDQAGIKTQMEAAHVIQAQFENPAQRYAWNAELLESLKPTRVVYSSFEADDLDRLARAKDLRPEIKVQVDRFLQFGKKLQEDYEPEITFGGGLPAVHDLQYIRPSIQVWKRKSTR